MQPAEYLCEPSTRYIPGLHEFAGACKRCKAQQSWQVLAGAAQTAACINDLELLLWTQHLGLTAPVKTAGDEVCRRVVYSDDLAVCMATPGYYGHYGTWHYFEKCYQADDVPGMEAALVRLTEMPTDIKTILNPLMPLSLAAMLYRERTQTADQQTLQLAIMPLPPHEKQEWVNGYFRLSKGVHYGAAA